MKQADKLPFALILITLSSMFYIFCFKTETRHFIVDDYPITKSAYEYEYSFFDYTRFRHIYIMSPEELPLGAVIEVKSSFMRIENWRIVSKR